MAGHPILFFIVQHQVLQPVEFTFALPVTIITVTVLWQVWCPMTREFMAEYLKCDSASRKQLLYVMNPNKFQACQFLVQYHEEVSSAAILACSLH
jgi:ERCC3/RAD25/XPB C-terminal helicase